MHVLEQLLRKFPEHGEFEFESESDLRELAVAVPDSPGIYIFENHNGELCYVAKSGTLLQNGNFRDQLLKKRIGNRQDGIPRQRFLREKLQITGWKFIRIRWFVTFSDEIKEIPAKVEAEVLQAYFLEHGELPLWNKSI
jgi:hypothetical protein